MQHIIKHFMRIMIYAVTAVGFGGGTAMAATCAPAGAQGAAPAAWQTYCWLDFSSYNDTAVRSASGQNFSFDLDDGSKLTFTLNATSTTASAADDRAAPSWSGAAVGNSSFLNIPGRPILYMANAVLQISKQSAVIFDPVNGSANPKAIPDAIIRYTIEVTNHGDAPVDTSSIQITDILPANISYNGASPIMFTDGATSSGLDSFDPSTMADFSIQPTGVAPYGYAPNATGFDSNVTGIIVNPSGILAASNGTDDPSFTISFEARLD